MALHLGVISLEGPTHLVLKTQRLHSTLQVVFLSHLARYESRPFSPSSLIIPPCHLTRLRIVFVVNSWHTINVSQCSRSHHHCNTWIHHYAFRQVVRITTST